MFTLPPPRPFPKVCVYATQRAREGELNPENTAIIQYRAQGKSQSILRGRQFHRSCVYVYPQEAGKSDSRRW